MRIIDGFLSEGWFTVWLFQTVTFLLVGETNCGLRLLGGGEEVESVVYFKADGF